MDQLRGQVEKDPVAAQQAPQPSESDSEAMLKLRLQLLEQQKECAKGRLTILPLLPSSHYCTASSTAARAAKQVNPQPLQRHDKHTLRTS